MSDGQFETSTTGAEFARTAAKKETASLGLARYLAWVTLLLVLGLAVTLAIVFGNTARDTLFAKQRSFARIMAENLNHQIFVRFYVPTIAGFGRIALRQQVQYERLNTTVQSLIHGLHVHSLRIYDHEGMVTYSAANRDEAGRTDLATQAVLDAPATDYPVFATDARIPYWKAFFRPLQEGEGFRFLRIEPGSFYLRTTYPLRIENRITPSDEMSAPVLGVLEFTQDITEDILSVVQFQWSIIGVTLFSALVLFGVLMMFLQRAQSALARRVEEEQRLLSELHQHEKLAGMGRVVAGIAHEIRNPLGIIRSSSELLLRRAAGSDPVNSKILQAIFDESKRLSQTVSDFLDYAKPRPPQRAPVDMGRVVDDVLAFLEGEFGRQDITVEKDFPENGEALVVAGDKDLFYRAAYNILVNSAQAMDGVGVIRIQARVFSENGLPLVALLFSDSGPGFPREGRERLLDPFVTTKDGGTGLGLPIVNNIITSQGGWLSLDDAPGGGALVRVILPVWQGENS